MSERQIKRPISPRPRSPDISPEQGVEEEELLVEQIKTEERVSSPGGRQRSTVLVSEMPGKSEKARRGVEEQLIGFGYQPHHWIFARDEAEREAPSYILAHLFGEKVLIELDTTIPRIGALGRDLRVRQKLTGASVLVPSGEDLTVCGAAAMSSGGFCALSRNPESQDLEPRHFTVISKPKEEAAILGDPALPIPIVRLSQIQANNNLVMRTIMQQTARFRLAAIAQLEVRKLSFLQAVRKLQKAAQVIADTKEGAFALANSELQEFIIKTKAKRDQLSFPPSSAEAKIEFEKTISYCRLCNDKFEKLIVHSGHLLNLTEEIGEMIADLEEMLSNIKSCSQ